MHCKKLDCRANLAKILMPVPKPPVNLNPLCFQQVALWCDHRTSPNTPRGEK
jgi:hypothetical protein